FRDAADGIGDRLLDVAALLHVVRDTDIGPATFQRRTFRDQLIEDGSGFLVAVVLVQIDRVAIGLRGAVHGLRGPFDQLVEIGFAAGEGRAHAATGARGYGNARGGPIHIAGDARFMPKPGAQIAIHLADGDAGVGDLHLDVVAPIVRVARGS